MDAKELEELIKKIEEKKFDQPDSSQWSYDQGWNKALDEAIAIIKQTIDSLKGG